jgi:hypothetical protein
MAAMMLIPVFAPDIGVRGGKEKRPRADATLLEKEA